MKNSLILIIILSSFANGFAQDFYDINTIQTIEITFSESNWDALLDAEKSGDENYIMAKTVSINGEIFDSVGVKYKGNSTYNPNQTKNPLHIELDTYKEQDYDGYTDIKLSNVANDPSFVREVLSYQILQQYMDAPLSNYANVYVNGNLIGLYSNSESVSKKFVKSRFYSKNNTFVKCNPPAGAGPNTSDLPNLVYLGQDSSAYYDAYEMKSDYGWQELINLCDTLVNNIENIEDILDVDRALWMLAFNNVLVNLDSYSGGFAQNYYLYRDDNGRFAPIMWDFNESFGRFAQTGSSNLNSTTDKQQMSHLLHENDANYPLIKQLLGIPMYKRMYLAHMKTILLENFDDNSYYNTGQALQNTIDAAVQADANKFFTYSDFITNLTTDITSGGGPRPSSTNGITSLMDGRNTYLLGLSDLSKTEPEISEVSISDDTPVIGQNSYILAKIENANSVYIGYRDDMELPFTRIQMFDDGAHEDGAANDGIFGVEIMVSSPLMQYYIYADNDEAGKFSPQRAEREYHSLTATISDLEPSDLVINEFMASNDATVADQDNEYNDWIELYNNSSSAINLEGYYLSDDADSLMLWPFPAGTTIEANGYITVWADKDEEQAGLHANFKLSSASESIFLVDGTGAIIDEVSYYDQTKDISYGRYPNGTGSFQSMQASFGAENILGSISGIETNIETDILVYPNPSSGIFNIEIDSDIDEEFYIFNLSGKLVYQDFVYQSSTINASHWEPGMYILKLGLNHTKIIIE